jgi:hypothetical protein
MSSVFSSEFAAGNIVNLTSFTAQPVLPDLIKLVVLDIKQNKDLLFIVFESEEEAENVPFPREPLTASRYIPYNLDPKSDLCIDKSGCESAQISTFVTLYSRRTCWS